MVVSNMIFLITLERMFDGDNSETTRKNPRNIYLKQIHSGLSSVTRGVEGFDDRNVDKKFSEVCTGLYDIVTELEKLIKW